MKKIICLHAAEANKQLVEEAIMQLIPSLNMELKHTVNEELLAMIREQQPLAIQKSYVYKTMLGLISQAPDLIFITCTNYIALLDEVELPSLIPIIRIDELLFQQCQNATHKPIKLLFTNEHTIAGTVARANKCIVSPFQIEPLYIPHLFDLYVSGRTKEHDSLLVNYIVEQDFTHYTIAVGQLSMARAAQQCKMQYNLPIIDAVSALVDYLNHYLSK